MSTLVAQHDKKSFCSSFPPKRPKRSRRQCETRSNSAPQTLANQKTSNLMKATSPGLSPQDSTGNGLESIKSLVEEEEAPDNTPVAVQLHIPTFTDPSPLRDVCQRSIGSDHSTSNVRRVLNYLTKSALHENRMEFHGVRAREFESIERILGETARAMLNLSRLAYDYNTRILIISMPTVLHETLFDDLKDLIGDAIKAFPYDRAIISPKIHMTRPLDTKDGWVTPDMTISVTALEGPTEVVMIPFYGECALTETDEHVFGKVEDVIAAHPDVICVVVVLVREATKYAAPVADSTASKTLHGGTDSEPQPLTLKSFINLRTTPRSFGEPVMVADHTWCHVASVEYFVWVRKDETPIDIRSDDPADMAYGILVPMIDMNAVMQMLERGLIKIKESFVAFQKQIEPHLDFTILEEARITSLSDWDWNAASKRLMSASDITAHKRYLEWYKSLFMTEDSDNAPYVDSQEVDEGNQVIAEGSEPSTNESTSRLGPVTSDQIIESVEAGGCATLTLPRRFQLHPIKQRRHHEDSIARRFADWYKQSHFRDKFDIHPCAYSMFLRIVGWFHEDISSHSNSPTGTRPRRYILLQSVPLYAIHVLPLMATSSSRLSMLKAKAYISNLLTRQMEDETFEFILGRLITTLHGVAIDERHTPRPYS
ncbi:uncharacterized protein HD556DRAFT_1451489 [Suillus plorans]|uniref:Uncharacterized protein n=1 Tax=Suillus plorans TaxID=116603 RepID=A0A9P7AAP8_9AGAM|nr:uncharacterized protein HD556DRAFT_1451489 [Suillus plorans]KAG1784685.1 hypothetical protein HD556DRAFT_1451489 [Suillus plorans]